MLQHRGNQEDAHEAWLYLKDELKISLPQFTVHTKQFCHVCQDENPCADMTFESSFNISLVNGSNPTPKTGEIELQDHLQAVMDQNSSTARCDLIRDGRACGER